MRSLIGSLALVLLASASHGQELFDKTFVRDFYFEFSDPNWWTKIENGSRVKGDLKVDGICYVDIGLRIKGASSALVPGVKKPFNLEMNAFVSDQDLYGFSTLNLNNGAVDPTLTREVISYEILRQYMPAPRTAYVRVHMNQVYWGIYILVEQPNKDFLEDWFRSDEGTRYKGDDPNGTRLESSTLQWFGSSPSSYANKYEIKNPEHPDAWTDLIEMLDELNNTTDAEFKARIDDFINIDRALWYMVCMNLFVNSDDYVGGGHNYYMYFNPDDGRMNMIPWDLNEAYGVHYPPNNPWRYSITYRSGSNSRPLWKRLYADPQWRELYFAHYRTVMRAFGDWDTVIGPMNQQFQDLIRADVEADDNYLYPDHFDPSFSGRFWAHFHWVHGLTEVTVNRKDFLLGHEALTKPEPQIEQVSLLTPHPVPGDQIVVTARVTGTPPIQEVELRHGVVGAYQSAPMYDDGLHNDGFAGDGLYGGSFLAGAPLSTMKYYIRATNTDGTIQVSPPKAEHEVHTVLVEPGPGSGPIRINELLADNDSVDTDEAGDYDDWVELFNESDQAYDLSGHYLSDDPAEPKKWSFPNGTILQGKSHLRIWADNEPLEGPYHANFKLAKDGEGLLLVDTDGRGNSILDAVSWGPQKSDRSFGRVLDGGENFYYVWDPTGERGVIEPGESNRYDQRRTGSPNDFDLKVEGSPRVGDTFSLELERGQPNTSAILLVGVQPTLIETPSMGPMLVSLQGAVLLSVSLDSQGDGSLGGPVPPLLGGITFFSQGLSLDFSNGVALWIAP